MTVAAVLSDLDGVLVDSVGAARRAWTAWGDGHGIDGAALMEANHGRPARAVIAEVVEGGAVEEGVIAIREAEIADAEGQSPLPGAADVLGLPVVAVVTSCDLPLALARLRGAGLPVPDVLVTSDMVLHGKPAPDAYLLAAERLGVDPSDCVVLEDAPAGVAAGRAAGMTVWAVTTTHDPDDLDAAHLVGSGLPELLERLRRAG